MSVGISLDPGQWIQSGKQNELAQNQYKQQEFWNEVSSARDRERLDFAKEQYRDARMDKWSRNHMKKLVKDANEAGLSISTALGGASGSTPTTVSIPGQTTNRVLGNANTGGSKGALALSLQNAQQKSQLENQLISSQDRLLSQQAQYWTYKALNEHKRWQGAGDNQLPTRYDLYEDNTSQAMEHIRKGGYVMPAGSSMELPESIGAYNFGRPYVKEEQFLTPPNVNAIDMNIAP